MLLGIKSLCTHCYNTCTYFHTLLEAVEPLEAVESLELELTLLLELTVLLTLLVLPGLLEASIR